MKKICFIILCLFIGMMVCMLIFAGQFTHQNSDVWVEKMDYSVRDVNGDVLAECYYEKPVISTNHEKITKKINSYFDEEEKKRFYSVSEDGKSEWNLEMKDFLGSVESMREELGDDAMVEAPLTYCVDTDITFLDKHTFSVRQIDMKMRGGPSRWKYSGSTFDLKTGELISLDKLIAINPELLSDMIVETISKRNWFSQDELERIVNIYGNMNESYGIQDGEDEIKMNYEYWYDGKYIYIILNYGFPQDASYLIRWSGSVEDVEKCEIVGYIRENSNVISEIVYES